MTIVRYIVYAHCLSFRNFTTGDSGAAKVVRHGACPNPSTANHTDGKCII